jgi:glutamyl-tRNA synthetase
LQQKRAFNCFCAPSDEKYDGTCKYLTDEETIDREDPFVVRMKEPDFTISFSDHVQGDASFEPQEMDNFIILTQDKQPTYNFACAIDDILHDTSLIIRDENHLLDTPKQIAIQHALNYAKTIEYAHLPSVKGTHITVKTLLSEGFVPEAIANYLILLSVKTPTDIFSLDEAIEWFKLENISTSPETFDHDKLRLLNREHLKRMDETELSRYVGFADSDIGALAKLYLEEVSTLNELRNKIERLFAPKKIPTEFEKEANVLGCKIENLIK